MKVLRPRFLGGGENSTDVVDTVGFTGMGCILCCRWGGGWDWGRWALTEAVVMEPIWRSLGRGGEGGSGAVVFVEGVGRVGEGGPEDVPDFGGGVGVG